MNTRFDLVTRGNPVMDFLHTPDGDIVSPGGSSATVAIVASKLGLRTGLIGQVGEDDYGRQLIQELTDAGVDISRLRVSGSTVVTPVDVSPYGRKLHTPNTYKTVALDECDVEYIRRSHAFFARATSDFFADAVNICRNGGVILFASLQKLRPDDRYETGLLCSSPVRIIFGNESEVDDEVKNIRGKTVVVTEGENGCTVYDHGGRRHFPAYPANRVDPTGAGDTHAGTFIAGYLNGWPLERTANFANRIGALATAQYGNRTFLKHHDLRVMV